MLFITTASYFTACSGSGGITGGVVSGPTNTTGTIISHIHDTGQSKCYDSSAEIACPASGQAFFGQDANYSSNPLRFTDNGSTVTDSITGLMWQKVDSGTQYNWYQATGIFDATYNNLATNVCGSLSIGGYSDWRLPSRRELASIINYGQFPEGPDNAYFQWSGPDYWTSSETVVSSGVAWGASGGRITYGFGSKGGSGLYVRCTRGPSWGQNRFIDNGDGTVSDTMSGLVWQQNDDGVARNWKDALAYCENLTFASFSDWRLPDIKELESLVNINSANLTNQMPAVDSTYFPSTRSSYYWSSTTFSFSGQLNYAWYVDFSFGWVDWGGDSKTDYNFTRCVR